MKISQFAAAAIAALSLITTQSFAKEDVHKSSKESDHGDLASMQIRRVTQDSVDQRFTANDLIGASLYDSSGETIGNIADISISGLDLGKKLGHSKKMKSMDKQSKNSWESKDKKSEDWSQDSSSRSPGQVTAFLSVGGLFGIGDDIVAVPVEQISWDSSEERFTLSTSKTEIVALAEQDPVDFEDETDNVYYSSKQTFDDDAISVRHALQAEENQKELAGVMVEENDETIVLRGVVRSEDAKELAAKIARENSGREIENSIEVKKY